MNQAWPTKRLADVCQILGGATPSKKNPKFYGGDIPWATVGDMNVEIITTTEEYITKAAVADCSTNVIPSGSIVMATRVGLGKVCVLGQDTAINQDLKGLTPKNTKELTTRWLFWWLKSKASDIQKAGTGATVQGVKMTFVQELEIPLPPVAEQKRIVALLDEAFAGIDEAKAKAEANKRASAELLKSQLHSSFTQGAGEWVEATLGETCDMYQPKTIGTKDLIPDGPYPVFGANGIIGRYDKYNHDEPQLLVTCRGATCGAVNMSLAKSWITGNAMVVRPKLKELDLHFLEFFFRGGIDISVAITGTAQPQITRTNLEQIKIRYPQSTTEQAKLVRKFVLLTEETRLLYESYSKKAASLVEFKSSLLSQAFAGELTA